jgi:hypothetical protein
VHPEHLVPLGPSLTSPARLAGCGAGRPSAAKISGVGLKRSAAFGMRMMSVRRAISTLTFAVIPGFSFSSGLGTSMTVA